MQTRPIPKDLPENCDEPPAFGCVLFDSQDMPGPGWACISDGATPSKPIRIASTGDLDTDIVWVSNLNFQSIRQARLNTHAKIRREDFFRGSLYQLASELGFRLHEDPLNAIAVIAILVGRTMRAGQSLYGLPLLQETLKDSLLVKIRARDSKSGNHLSPSGPPVLQSALEQAFQARQKCEGRIPRGTQTIAFRWPRAEYARLLMGYPIPSGEWEYAEFPSNVPDHLMYDKLIEIANERPVLCRVAIRDVEPDFQTLFSFGNEHSQRLWAPVHEVAALARHAKIKVKDMFVAARHERLGEIDALRLPTHEAGAIDQVSLSAGLLYENHWVGLASKQYVRAAQKSTVSPLAVWLRAWDRLLCFKAAIAFHQAGHHVTSYGIGAVNVALWPQHYRAAVDLASSLNMAAPLLTLKDMVTEERAAKVG